MSCHAYALRILKLVSPLLIEYSHFVFSILPLFKVLLNFSERNEKSNEFRLKTGLTDIGCAYRIGNSFVLCVFSLQGRGCHLGDEHTDDAQLYEILQPNDLVFCFFL